MRYRCLSPHESLRPFVACYLMVEDLEGIFERRMVRTCPEPLGVLVINSGAPSIHESGRPIPSVGVFGVQTTVRRWVVGGETFFVAAMLTLPGVMSLFPHLGGATADALVDLSDLWGDKQASTLRERIPDVWDPPTVKTVMDSWMVGKLFSAPGARSDASLQTYKALMCTQRVDLTCKELGIAPRTLQRWFNRHIGVGPKRVLGLHRLQNSIRESRRNRPGSLRAPDGYSDQAHLIRNWRRHLGITPGQYQKTGASELANVFSAAADKRRGAPVFYL